MSYKYIIHRVVGKLVSVIMIFSQSQFDSRESDSKSLHSIMDEERRRNKQSVAALFKDLNEMSLILGAKSDERLNV